MRYSRHSLFLIVLLGSALAAGLWAAPSPVKWVDALSLGLEGQGWSALGHPYDRLPERAEGMVPSRVWDLSHDSAGLVLRFATDSGSLQAHWRLRREALAMRHMPATGVSGLDLYVWDDGRWRWMSVGQRISSTEVTQVLFENLEPKRREFMLYLPLYNGIDQLRLGVAEEAGIESLRSPARPIVVYGTSIVQGACASRPGRAYTAILGRRLNRPVINLGFSGNARSEPELAGLIAELDPAVFVLDSLPNLQPEQVERVDQFVEIIRTARPKTPIVLVGGIEYANADFQPELRDRVLRSNRVLSDIFRRRSEQDPWLYLIPYEGLLGDDGEGTVDGTHPTDLGFLRMADRIEPVLRQALRQVSAWE